MRESLPVILEYLSTQVSAAEDPEKILDQAVAEMQEDLIKMRQASAQASGGRICCAGCCNAADCALGMLFRRCTAGRSRYCLFTQPTLATHVGTMWRLKTRAIYAAQQLVSPVDVWIPVNACTLRAVQIACLAHSPTAHCPPAHLQVVSCILTVPERLRLVR